MIECTILNESPGHLRPNAPCRSRHDHVLSLEVAVEGERALIVLVLDHDVLSLLLGPSEPERRPNAPPLLLLLLLLLHHLLLLNLLLLLVYSLVARPSWLPLGDTHWLTLGLVLVRLLLLRLGRLGCCATEEFTEVHLIISLILIYE